MPPARRASRAAKGGPQAKKKRRESQQQQRELMEALIGRKVNMKAGSHVHVGVVRGVVLYEREHLLDVLWDDGDEELMSYNRATGCLLPAEGEVNDHRGSEDGKDRDASTPTGRSTRATSTRARRGRRPRKQARQDAPEPNTRIQPASPKVVTEDAPSISEPSVPTESAATTRGRVVMVRAHHRTRTSSSDCLLPELFMARDTKGCTTYPSEPRGAACQPQLEGPTLALRRLAKAGSLAPADLLSSALKALLDLVLGAADMTFKDYVCVRKLQGIVARDAEEGMAMSDLSTTLHYLCTLAVEVASLKSASSKFSIEGELDYGDYLLNKVVDTSAQGALHEASLWFDGPEGCKSHWGEKDPVMAVTTQEVCEAFERRVRARRAVDDEEEEEIVSPTNRPCPTAVLGKVLEDLPADESFKPLPSQTDEAEQMSDGEERPLGYSLVVDSCQDATLRRYIRRSHDFMPEGGKPVERTIRELQSFVRRKTAPKRYTQGGNSSSSSDGQEGYIEEMALANGGVVNISAVTAGCSSRPQAVLFKALCDANGISCRLVKQEDGVYYNSVLIRDRVIEDDTVPVEEGEESEDGQPMMDMDEEEEDDSDFEETSEAPSSNAGEDDISHKALEAVYPITWHTGPDTPSPMSSPGGACPSLLAAARELCRHPLDRLIIDAGEATSTSSINLDEYLEFTTRIGKGSFGEVWKVKLLASEGSDEEALLARPSPTGEYALKMVPEAHIDEEEGELMRVYCSCGHPCITEVVTVFYGHQQLPSRRKGSHHVERFWCCLMSVEDTSLEVLLKARDKYVRKHEGDEVRPEEVPVLLDLRFTFRLLIDTAFAMMFLHTSTKNRDYVLHRDLKPANILLTKRDASAVYRARLTDFGVARANPGQDTNMTIGLGTDGYIAPEQHGIEYDRPADVWSFGVTLARICGLDSWKDVAVTTTHHTHHPGGGGAPPPEPMLRFPPAADPFLCELCLQCISRQPLRRPTFRDIYRSLITE
ncbi:hypothetical protein FOL47_006482 [Perkinsus chesapeaki]|uniref:Protein kinase domain-containing protein n=1 Tax=Perkinsus chesapeaki TaxID=330153 RepID=A0A7J6LRN5_PERCH|nr:hypothetical protein FOL47_006482 [Perkinsus chesapeaki]